MDNPSIDPSGYLPNEASTAAREQQQPQNNIKEEEHETTVQSSTVPEQPQNKTDGRIHTTVKSSTTANNRNNDVSLYKRAEAFLFNHGADIAFWTFYISINIIAAAWGVKQFVEPQFTTDSDILRMTLPIARAGGRLVTLNCAMLLLTACKFFWSLVRDYTIIPLGFPVDNIMPEYHRIVALVVIFSGVIVHAIPQFINYGTRQIVIESGVPIWTFGEGFSSKQLLITGVMLTVIFIMFYLTTLKAFRKTATGFRWFWNVHMAGIVLAYPLLIIHGTYRGSPIFLKFAVAPLLLYLIDVAARKVFMVSNQAKVVEWSAHQDQDERVTKLVVEKPGWFNYTPGQYAEIKIPSLSKSEWHPFTIASAPKERDEDEQADRLVFYIKSAGRWTGKLYERVTSCQGKISKEDPPIIWLRGPHGAPAVNYDSYKHLVVVGTGVGVTPLLSIWQYLSRKGVEAEETPTNLMTTTTKSSSAQQHGERGLSSEQFLDRVAHDLTTVDVFTFQNTPIDSIRMRFAYVAGILETMTVNMCLLIILVAAGTSTVVIWMFTCTCAAKYIEATSSALALAVYGSKVLLSFFVYGRRYAVCFICWLECFIVLNDVVALGSSIRTYDPQDKGDYVHIFFYTITVVLHFLRTFYIFYATATPPSGGWTGKTGAGGKKIKVQINSIHGIWVSKYFSNMRYAASDLADAPASPVFDLDFYGTREEGTTREEQDIEDGVAFQKHGGFHTGRPDWEQVFCQAISKAHSSNPDEGEPVGVFFCGSPAVARELRRTAQKVTTEHQHASGNCKCRLIVHKENF